MLSSSSLAETDSIHHRHAQSPVTPHRRLSLASIVHPDPLKPVLPTDEVTLKRHLGLFSGVCYIIGITIGNVSCVVFHRFIMIICYY
jgi:hypothetical protein